MKNVENKNGAGKYAALDNPCHTGKKALLKGATTSLFVNIYPYSKLSGPMMQIYGNILFL